VIRDVFRRGEAVAAAQRDMAPGSSEGDRDPSVAWVSDRQHRGGSPGSRVATVDDAVHAPCRRPSSRSAWTSAPTAST